MARPREEILYDYDNAVDDFAKAKHAAHGDSSTRAEGRRRARDASEQTRETVARLRAEARGGR